MRTFCDWAVFLYDVIGFPILCGLLGARFLYRVADIWDLWED